MSINKYRMNLYSVIYIVSMVLFSIADCRLLSKKHVKRQTQDVYQNQNQMFQPSYQSQLSYPEDVLVPKFNPLLDNPSNIQPVYAGLTSENIGSDSARLAPGNINPGSSVITPRNLSQGNVGLAAGNLVPDNTGFMPENVAQGKAELAAGYAVPGNIELAAGNVVPSNSELAAGYLSPGNKEGVPGFVAADNTGSLLGNVAPGYTGLAYSNEPQENARSPAQIAAFQPQNPSSSGNFENSGSIGLPPLPPLPVNQNTGNENILIPPSFKNPITNASPAPALQALPNSNASIYPMSNIKLKRRKKNAPYKNDELDELLEKGKKLFEGSADKTNKSHRLKLVDDYIEDELKENNATIIPLANGVQLKSVTKQGKKKINSVVNITSSTQRTLVFDNTTEIENTLEMQMEKNIEDDKGANRGSEEVRIIETERVKPIVNQRLNGLSLLKKKRSYDKIFTTHRRSKRSIMFSTEQSISNSLFDKMAHRFINVVNRGGRITYHKKSPKRHITPNFRENSRRKIANSDSLTRDMIPDRTEIDDFVKFFLKQMRKYRKSQERKKNQDAWPKELHFGEFRNDTQLSAGKNKTARANFELIKELNVLWNFSVKWNTVIRNQVTPRNVTENESQLMNVEKTTAKETTKVLEPTTKSSTHQVPVSLVYVDERNDSGLGMTLLFLIITLFSVMSVLFTLGKEYRIKQICDLNTKSRAYGYYHKGKRDELETLKCARIENAFLEDYPQLEWQSENGDWLIEKDTDFK